MSAQRGPEGNNGGELRPRVIVLDSGDSATVEVLEVPETATLGYRFCHRGRSWCVTGRRTAERVLIATLAEGA